MSETVRVPDISDFADLVVSEILVAEGDFVDVENCLITIEGDEATLDVPSPTPGTIEAVLVQVGDTVSEGDARRTPDRS